MTGIDITQVKDIYTNFAIDKLAFINPTIFKTLVDSIAKILKKDKTELYEKVGKYLCRFLIDKFPQQMTVCGRNIIEFLNNFSDMIHNMDGLARQLIDDNLGLCFCHQTTINVFNAQFFSDEYFYQSILLGFIEECNWMLFNNRTRCIIVRPWDSIDKIFIIEIHLAKSSAIKFHSIDSIIDDLLDKDFIDHAIPCHILFNINGVVKEVGELLQNIMKNIVNNPRIKFNDVFKIINPKIELQNIEDVKKYVNISVILKPRPNMVETQTNGASENDDVNCRSTEFCIKGQFCYIEHHQNYWFIGYPHFIDVVDLQDNGFFISDIPIQNGARDALVLQNNINNENNYTNKMSKLMIKLKEIKNDLANECIKTEKIIYELYPQNFATKLINGTSINAVNYTEIVVLCSDIVNFTSLSNTCTPIQIISFLKTVFGEFDNLCNRYNLIKIETSGDGYMIAAGIQNSKSKFTRIIKCGLKMIESLFTTKTNINRHIMIRVGVFSGPVIAGIVGLHSPRFCIFGRTVAQAIKLEQTAPPNKIHISKGIYKNIKHNKKFKIYKKTIPNDNTSSCGKDFSEHTYIVEVSNLTRSIKDKTVLLPHNI